MEHIKGTNIQDRNPILNMNIVSSLNKSFSHQIYLNGFVHDGIIIS
jgi:hypothetical protein